MCAYNYCFYYINLNSTRLVHNLQLHYKFKSGNSTKVRKLNELFYAKIIPLLNEKGLNKQTPRKEWPISIQMRVLKELMNEAPRDQHLAFIAFRTTLAEKQV